MKTRGIEIFPAVCEKYHLFILHKKNEKKRESKIILKSKMKVEWLRKQNDDKKNKQINRQKNKIMWVSVMTKWKLSPWSQNAVPSMQAVRAKEQNANGMLLHFNLTARNVSTIASLKQVPRGAEGRVTRLGERSDEGGAQCIVFSGR